MYQSRAQHPLGKDLQSLPDEVRESMWQLFVAIGRYWGTIPDPLPLRSRLDSFMANRMALMPLYIDYYKIAHEVIAELIEAHKGNADAAYAELFTNADAAKQPPTTQLALTRQLVSNEFVALQYALGGFLAFGAKNVPGYFGGANAPGAPPPYRAK